MAEQVRRFVLTDHICRKCGIGRVLQQTNGGPTGGGNPGYCCSNCEESSSGISTSCLCWCDQIIDRGGLPYETRCHRGRGTVELTQAGWKVRSQQYAMCVLWRYAPEESTNNPDFERAETFLNSGELPTKGSRP